MIDHENTKVSRRSRRTKQEYPLKWAVFGHRYHLWIAGKGCATCPISVAIEALKCFVLCKTYDLFSKYILDSSLELRSSALASTSSQLVVRENMVCFLRRSSKAVPYGSNNLACTRQAVESWEFFTKPNNLQKHQVHLLSAKRLPLNESFHMLECGLPTGHGNRYSPCTNLLKRA